MTLLERDIMERRDPVFSLKTTRCEYRLGRRKSDQSDHLPLFHQTYELAEVRKVAVWGKGTNQMYEHAGDTLDFIW